MATTRLPILDGSDKVYIAQLPVGTTTGTVAAGDDPRITGALPATGGTLSGPLQLQSSTAGGPDNYDTTSRLTIGSYQTNGVNFFGEGIRLDLNEVYAKNMIAWRLPRPVAPDVYEQLETNLSFEANTTGWVTVGACTLTQSAAQFLVGGYSGLVTWASGAGASQGITSTVTGLSAGVVYTVVAWVFVPAANPAVQLTTDAAGTVPSVSTTSGAWQKLTTTFTASATSHLVKVLSAATTTNGQTVYVDAVMVTPPMSAPRSVAWLGAHYEAQDLGSVHGHLSIEVPNAADQLKTRFEIKFVDAAGKIGLDKTLVQTTSADLVADCANGQMLRLQTGAGVPKLVEFANDQWGTTPRFRAGVNSDAETGANAGGNFQIERFTDAGSSGGVPLFIARSGGRTTIGGPDGSQSGLDVRRNAPGTALNVISTGNGTVGYLFTGNTADTTGVAVAAKVAGDTTNRFSSDVTGKMQWADGTTTADTNLYRTAAGVLKTDGALTVTELRQFATVAKTATFTAAAGNLYIIDTSGGALTATLPAAATAGQQIMLKLNNGANTVTVVPTGADTLGALGASTTLTVTGEVAEFTSSGGGAWHLTGGTRTLASLDTRYLTRTNQAAADHGLITWTFDPVVAATANAPSAAGTLQTARLHLPYAATVTSIVMWVATAGTGLTAGQNFAALYSGTGARLDVTADQSTAWTSTGQKTMTLAGGATARAAGDYLVVWWSNGTTMPQFATRSGANAVNVNLTAPTLRFSTADAGVTTTGPANLGTQAAITTAAWAALI